jgi:hypothetical protein
MKRALLWIPVLLLAAACSSEGTDELCAQSGLDPEVCGAVYDSSTVGGKADELAQMRGIVVERVGNHTYFKIPLAYTAEGEKRRLLEETVHKFTSAMTSLNQEMIERGIDLSGLLDEATAAEFNENYLATLDRIFDTEVDGEVELELGESYDEPKKLWSWQRYLVPQAFIAYFGTKFTANVGVGGGISATVLIVVQPWLSLVIDHTAAEPTVVDKDYQIDVAVLGVPNLDVGFGVGGGIPLRIGAGAVFGPLNQPEDIAGWGIGISGTFTVPLIGGGQAKFISVLQDPPLFLAMAGYNSGTGGSVEVHGNVQYIMDGGEFLDWITANRE